MGWKRRWPMTLGMYSLLGLLCGVMAGCNSSSASRNAQDKTVDAASGSSGPQVQANAAGPNIDLNCVINHLQNPQESFHYMFKDESQNPWSEEADVTPQMIAGSFKSNYMPGPSPLHATPQEMPHQYQWAIGRMASLVALVRDTTTNQGPETINGYSTTKIGIDTARGDVAEQGLYKTTFGPGGYAKGTAWVTAEGCPVKLTIDEELHANDGSVQSKAHYEEAMVKK